ncbi:MAG: thioredoxin fold domain-containing protein [candidate division Zixibacteria bacterium]|nr:thioredoxin fold domain-containing protein [candidate division Zixibacteria bacterium]
MTGREPEKKNPYYSSKVTWLLLVLVGVALLVVGLTIISEERGIKSDTAENTSDSAQIIEDTVKTVSEQEPAREDLAESIPWQSFNRALADIEGESRFAMMFFRAEECQPCDRMESEVFTQTQILDAFEHKVLPVRIESNSNERVEYRERVLSEAGLPDIFGISGFPTIMFYDGQTQKFLFTLPGFVEADKLHKIFEYLRGRMFETDSVQLQEYISR